jgi:hypothetical protein
MRIGILFAALAATSFLARPALAQLPGPAEKIVYKKRTVIDFAHSAEITGELVTPNTCYQISRKVSRFSTMITLRDSFAPELLTSPDRL